jgi:hypothetical protein
MLPFSRDLSLAPNVPFPSATGNTLQDYLTRIWRIQRGADFAFKDHFLGSALGANWTSAVSGTGAVAVVGDVAGGGNGAAKLSATSGGGTESASITSQALAIGVRDFWVSSRFRFADFSDGTSLVGLYNTPGDGLNAAILRPDGHSTFQLSLGETSSTDTVYELGVTVDSNYHQFDIVRVSGLVAVYIDDTLVSPSGGITCTKDFDNTLFTMSLNVPRAATSDLRIDSVDFWGSGI